MKYYSTSVGMSRNILLGAAVSISMTFGTISAKAQEIRVTVDGELVHFQDLGPQEVDGRTLVPVRGVLEKLGADVTYNPAMHTVTASTPKIDIQLTIGSRNAVVNAAPVTLDVPAQTINDHTFVPLRFLGESLGADIKWDAANRMVIIRTKHGDRDRDRAETDRGGREHLPLPPQGPPPVINSFTQTSAKWLKAGSLLEARLDGTPGGQAAFRVPGVVDDVPMREKSPGRYVGTWQVPGDRRIRIKSAAVIGSLIIGTMSAPLIQAGETVSIDTVGPSVRDLAPDDQAIVNDPRPSISAAFDDDGSGIDQANVRLTLNGRDVTGRATVTRDFIIYKPEGPLQPGPQQVDLSVVNSAGNIEHRHWGFNEQARIEVGIRSVSDNVVHMMQPGDTFRAEMQGSPGGRASFSSGSIQNVLMQEVRPGNYVADYTIRKGDDVADRPIAFHLAMPDGQKFEQMSVNVLRVSTGKPSAPIIISPGPSDAPSNPLVIAGKTQPNARIHVHVDYRNKLLGVLALQGTAADVVVVADGRGNWKTEPINVGRLLSNRGVEYTISAVAANGVGDLSDPAIVKIRVQ